MREETAIEQNRCCHLIRRRAHQAFFLDDEGQIRAVALMRRVEAGVQASMSYCIDRAVAISTDPLSPLGNAAVYEYDLRSRKTYEGGATYPVRYTYDIFGNKTTMTTYRDETSRTGGSPVQGDTTTWLYDIASGSMTNKVYADGKGSTYSYTPDGKLSRRTWARGIVTDYSYDNWGSLTNTVYSDNTPTVSLTYDALGRQISAHDAAGVTTFLYDSFGSLTNETVIGVAGTNAIARFHDNLGRDTGYALNGVRQSTLGYDSATARLLSMQISRTGGSPVQDEGTFSWSYLPGSDLKSSLAYPNGLTASWQYDANGQLLQVCNATPTNIISQYDYTYDAAGRRVSCGKTGSAFAQSDTIAYAYNTRSELTNAVAAVDSDYRYSYDFDDIGNRVSACECGTNISYMANAINQYTAVGDFAPQFDNDGNQTYVKTSTGVWSITYNGENRPVCWSCGTTNIVMLYDLQGRRVEYLEKYLATPDVFVTNVHYRFVYDNYCCVQRLNVNAGCAVDFRVVWDPTESISTRPLKLEKPGEYSVLVTHDGCKNVSELLRSVGGQGAVSNVEYVLHYDYSPFGKAVALLNGSVATTVSFVYSNPFGFSSEYHDARLGMVAYNYRHYNIVDGRWCSRDPKDELDGAGLYAFLKNRCYPWDILGLAGLCCSEFKKNVENGFSDARWSEEVSIYSTLKLDLSFSQLENTEKVCAIDIVCGSCSDDSRHGHGTPLEGGTAEFYKKSHWLVEDEIGVHVKICTDDRGETISGDLKQTARTFKHELIHARDMCRRERGFECGEFTVEALNSGKFDKRICTELHAYSEENRHIYGLKPWEKKDVISRALKSVILACMKNGNEPDVKFSEELKKRAAKMYDECKQWRGK